MDMVPVSEVFERKQSYVHAWFTCNYKQRIVLIAAIFLYQRQFIIE
jgi:hypothetical protein